MTILEEVRKALEERGEEIESELGKARLTALLAVIAGAIPKREGLLQAILDATTVEEIQRMI